MTMESALHEVARVYIEAAASSRTPLKVVADHFGVSQSTATRRVAAARKSGLVPEVTSTTNPYVAAICADLGVSVEAFEAAVRRHAPNGNLRVQVGKRG
ncbi:hypothetical protein [Microbacterium sp. p3-SID131]|uniref:hypothetical protein n=1 Tax=Microbacterium sp. p3-SID131 TaxID=2916215 RepID=UPI0021A699E1|nr:hypothetical protein [Microbacterium sp. p3-SID131]MCT1363295.1 hypothetical protein [Microbacterium sp. p3-SID131]